MATALGLGLGLPNANPVWESREPPTPPDPPGTANFGSTDVFFDNTTFTFDNTGS